MTAVTPNARRAKKLILFPKILPASFGLPLPRACPNRMVVPIARPLIITVIRCMIWLPVETADTSAAVLNRPTIKRSTAPYMDCRHRARSTGSANRIKGANIFPCVNCKLFSMANIIHLYCLFFHVVIYFYRIFSKLILNDYE